MKGVSMGKWILLDLQVSPIRKCKEFKIWLCQSAAPKFLMFGFMGLPWRGSWANKTLLWRHPRGSGSLYSLAGVLETLQPGETLPAAGEWRAFPPQSECLSLFTSSLFPSYIFPSGAHRGGKQSVGRRDADSPMQHQGQQLSLFPSQGVWRIISLLDDSPVPALLLCEFSCCYINASSSQYSQSHWRKSSVNTTSRQEISFEQGLFYSLVTHVIGFICCNEIFHKPSLHGLAQLSIAQLPGIFILAK